MVGVGGGGGGGSGMVLEQLLVVVPVGSNYIFYIFGHAHIQSSNLKCHMINHKDDTCLWLFFYPQEQQEHFRLCFIDLKLGLILICYNSFAIFHFFLRSLGYLNYQLTI